METKSKEIIVSQFEKMGARAKVIDLGVLSEREKRIRHFSDAVFNINVINDKKGEHFIIAIGDDINVTIPNLLKKEKHLLLNVSSKIEKNQINKKYLCGHDERHWFVASIPGTKITTVKNALEALKPEIVESSQTNLRKKDINKRHNKAFKRQGEWFFIPNQNFTPDPHFTFKNEPIVRGRAKPHMCETLSRKGGTTVMVNNSQFPNGLTMPEYEKFIKENPKKSYVWRQMTRDAQVFVKGKITHPDHKTLELIGWHLVVPNTESKAIQFKAMAFLD